MTETLVVDNGSGDIKAGKLGGKTLIKRTELEKLFI